VTTKIVPKLKTSQGTSGNLDRKELAQTKERATRRLRLKSLVRTLETPMLLLSFFWLFVIILELVYGKNSLLLWLGTGMWTLFVLFFLLKLVTTPNRTTYLKRSWLFILAILVSVLRFFPFLQSFTLSRAITATFGVQIVWMFASADIGMRSLRRVLGRRGAGYAFTFTIIVILAGAAGMLSFEKDSLDPQGIHTYPKAIWWATMQITNIGSGYRPSTPGGLVLCLAISIYSAGMFGYLTAILATFFIDRDAKDPGSEIAGQKSIQQLQTEIVSLHKSIDEVLRRLPKEIAVEEGPG
jgi:voltage-gated potassium channel